MIGRVVLFNVEGGGAVPAIVVREVDASLQLVELTTFQPLGYIGSNLATPGSAPGNWRRLEQPRPSRDEVLRYFLGLDATTTDALWATLERFGPQFL